MSNQLRRYSPSIRYVIYIVHIKYGIIRLNDIFRMYLNPVITIVVTAINAIPQKKLINRSRNRKNISGHAVLIISIMKYIRNTAAPSTSYAFHTIYAAAPSIRHSITHIAASSISGGVIGGFIKASNPRLLNNMKVKTPNIAVISSKDSSAFTLNSRRQLVRIVVYSIRIFNIYMHEVWTTFHKNNRQYYFGDYFCVFVIGDKRKRQRLDY